VNIFSDRASRRVGFKKFNSFGGITPLKNKSHFELVQNEIYNIITKTFNF
jgi:hypothetical protein